MNLPEEQTGQPQETRAVLLHLEWDSPLPDRRPRANVLRGALTRCFDETLLHQHENGRVSYRYPQVHYRWDSSQNKGILYGCGEGATRLLQLPLLGLELQLGQHTRQIVGAQSKILQSSVEPSLKQLRAYGLASPWLPFSQEAYAAYQSMSELEKAYERNRHAQNNILLMLRALGVNVTWPLACVVDVSKIVRPKHKGVSMLGFLGTLWVNTILPEQAAIGRAVSHGFGWLRSPEEQQAQTGSS